MNVVIRPEREEDSQDIFKVHAIAFGQNNESRLVELLRKSEAYVPGLSLVATVDDRIVGHILFTKINILSDSGESCPSLALAPMAVSPEFQGKGIGGQLIRRGLQAATDLNFRSVIVLGHEHYYPKFGFLPATKWNIVAPFEVPENAFMGIELVEAGFTGVSGTVQYPKEFEIV